MAPVPVKPHAQRRPPLLRRKDGALGSPSESRHHLHFARLRLVTELKIMTAAPRDATVSERRRAVIARNRPALEKHGLVIYTPVKIQAKASSLECLVAQISSTIEEDSSNNSRDDASMDSA